MMSFRKITEYAEKGYIMVEPHHLKELQAWKEIGQGLAIMWVIFIILVVFCF